MRLKNCPGCKRAQTTRSAKFLGRLEGVLWFNCLGCFSTFIIGSLRLMALTMIIGALAPTQSWAISADECFTAARTFDQHSKTIGIKISAASDQIGLVWLIPSDPSKTVMQDRSAMRQLDRICTLAGVKRSYFARPEDPSKAHKSCYLSQCVKEPITLKRVISISELLKVARLK